MVGRLTISVTLLELPREHGRIRVAETARITDASRHTIKHHLKALVDQGHLVMHGAGRGAWYGVSGSIRCQADLTGLSS